MPMPVNFTTTKVSYQMVIDNKKYQLILESADEEEILLKIPIHCVTDDRNGTLH